MTLQGEKSIYWSDFIYNNTRFLLVATEIGLAYVSSPNQPFKEVEQWIIKTFKDVTIIKSEAKLEAYQKEIVEFLRGERFTFTFLSDLQGTEFQRIVWDTLQTIPFGQTRSYSQIAEKMNKPKAVRAVARAIGANPVLIIVPCHRVVGKNGTLTGYRGGLKMKEHLLEIEKNDN